MISFVIKKTDDGLSNLYSYDSARGTFAKVKTADVIKFVKEPTHVLAWNAKAFAKSLIAVEHDEIYETFLSRETTVEFVEGVCIYERDGLWYINNSTKKEILLGRRAEIYFGVPEVFKVGKLMWPYFLDEHDSMVELCCLTEKNVVKVGPYLKVEANSHLASFICKRADGFYDVFCVRKGELVKHDNNEILWLTEGVYVWSDKLQAWCFYEGFRLYCDNVIYRCADSEFKTLCEVDKSGVRKVSEDGWEFCNGYIRVNGMRYYLNEDTGIVDFNNPQPEPKPFWQRLFGKR